MKRLFATAAICALPLSAAAQDFASVIERYLEPMNLEVDIDAASDQMRAGLAHDGGVFLPDADFSPLTRALLTVEAVESELMVSRTRLRLAETHLDGIGSVYLVEVARFNLGPAWHAELVEVYGAENVAPAEEFGTAPHVVWRMVMRPLMGNAALPEAAARIVIADPEAETCHGQPCTGLQATADSLTGWQQEQQVFQIPFSPPYPVQENDGLLSAAAAVDLMLFENGFVTAENPGAAPRWSTPEPREGMDEQPYMEIVIETGMATERAIDASMVETGLMDHATAEALTRVQSVSIGAGALFAYLSRGSVSR